MLFLNLFQGCLRRGQWGHVSHHFQTWVHKWVSPPPPLLDISCFLISLFPYIYAPSNKDGQIALYMSVMSFGLYVSLSRVQLITQDCFAPQASNLVGRKSLMSRRSLVIVRSVGQGKRPYQSTSPSASVN